MAVEAFRTLFNQSMVSKEGLFSFKKLSETLSLLTPERKEKQSLAYNDSEEKIVHDSKEAIIRNFCMNAKMIEINEFNISILSDFKEFLDFKTDSERTLAQTFFLLHISKTDFSQQKNPKSIFEYFFLNFSSINTHIDKKKYDEFHLIFATLIKRQNITNIINQSIDDIVVNTSTYDYNSLKLIFFTSRLPGVGGFSGKNRIFINTRPFLNMLDFKCFSEEIKKTTLKLEFIRLFFHETSHVVLRYKLGNLNISSPFLKQTKNVLVKNNVDECGVETERRVFKEKIDWPGSINNRYNFDYCKQYMEKLLNGHVEEFNVEKACVRIIDPKEIPRMAFSMRFLEYHRGF